MPGSLAGPDRRGFFNAQNMPAWRSQNESQFSRICMPSIQPLISEDSTRTGAAPAASQGCGTNPGCLLRPIGGPASPPTSPPASGDFWDNHRAPIARRHVAGGAAAPATVHLHAARACTSCRGASVSHHAPLLHLNDSIAGGPADTCFSQPPRPSPPALCPQHHPPARCQQQPHQQHVRRREGQREGMVLQAKVRRRRARPGRRRRREGRPGCRWGPWSGAWKADASFARM